MGLLSDCAGELGHRAWPPRGLPISQEYTEHVSNCVAKASVFCSHHGASSVSVGCLRGAKEVISENPSQLLEPTQRTHSLQEHQQDSAKLRDVRRMIPFQQMQSLCGEVFGG